MKILIFESDKADIQPLTRTIDGICKMWHYTKSDFTLIPRNLDIGFAIKRYALHL